jgi:hypothetical protein
MAARELETPWRRPPSIEVPQAHARGRDIRRTEAFHFYYDGLSAGIHVEKTSIDQGPAGPSEESGHPED